MRKKPFEPSEKMLKVREMLEKVPEGAFISYGDIEKQSGVKMDYRGKQIFRSAMKSLKRNYRCAIGEGVEMESPGNSMAIVTKHIKRVDNGLKRTGRVSRTMQDRYLDRMPEKDRPRLTAVVSLMGAISAVAGGLKRLYSDKPEALNTIATNKIEWKP